MTDQMEERARARQGAANTLEEALTIISDESREPDEWERACLGYGISALFAGAYGLAEAEAVLAMTPISGRSKIKPQPDPAIDQYDLKFLRMALRTALAEPVREYATFGPLKTG